MTLTAKEILERCRRAGAEMRRLHEKVDMYRDTAGRMTASLDGIGARSTGESDHMATIMGEIDSVERDLRQRDREYTAEVAAACKLLDMLPALECSVLNRYYVHGQNLRVIAQELGYSYNYVRNCKAAGCRQLASLGEGEVMRLLPYWYIIEDCRSVRLYCEPVTVSRRISSPAASSTTTTVARSVCQVFQLSVAEVAETSEVLVCVGLKIVLPAGLTTRLSR